MAETLRPEGAECVVFCVEVAAVTQDYNVSVQLAVGRRGRAFIKGCNSAGKPAAL